MRTMGIGMIKELVSLFYPCYCIHCAERLPSDRRYICEECFNLLPLYVGMETFYAVDERIAGLLPYTEYSSDLIFTSKNSVRKIIHQIKYHGSPELGYSLTSFFAPRHKELGHFADVSAIVPIPLSPKRMRQRGYNQSTFIAQGLSDIYKLPMEEKFLRRGLSKGGTQTLRGKDERWNKVEGAFYVPKESDVVGRRILLVDDVLTTGSTLVNAGRTLIDAGAESVSFYTLALDILS